MQLLEAYLLQGTTAVALATKVLHSFKEAIQDTATRIVRSMVLSKSGMSESLASSSLEVAYADLCKALPRELLRPCMNKLMEVMFDALHSYHFMQHWHEAAAAATQAAAGAASSSSSRDTGGEGNPGAEQEEQQQQVQLATQQLLAGVCTALMKNRETVWEIAAVTIRDLLRVPGACKAEDFLQVGTRCALSSKPNSMMLSWSSSSSLSLYLMLQRTHVQLLGALFIIAQQRTGKQQMHQLLGPHWAL